MLETEEPGHWSDRCNVARPHGLRLANIEYDEETLQSAPDDKEKLPLGLEHREIKYIQW